MKGSAIPFSLATLVPFCLLTLPATLLVCYKPCMRKWMRDRLKRKKKTDDAKTESGPAPLQPAYFDAGKNRPLPLPPAAAERNHHPKNLQPLNRRNQFESSDEESTPVQAASGPMLDVRFAVVGVEEVVEGAVLEPPRRRARQTKPPEPRPQSRSCAHGGRRPAPPSKGMVVLAIGLPGSGKSSWFKRHNITALSS